MRRNVSSGSPVSNRVGSGWSHASMAVKPAAGQAFGGRFGGLVVGLAEPAIADRGEDRPDRGDVPGAAALGDEPATGPDDRGEVAEQRVVVGHPVERRGRQDRVGELAVGQREWPAEVGDDERHPIAEPLEPAARLIDHRRRSVEGDDAAAR